MQDEDSQNMTPLSAREVIEKFGGIRPAAKAIGVAFTTVQGWKERDHIPDHRWQELRAAAAEQGIDLGPERTGEEAAQTADAAGESGSDGQESGEAAQETPPTPDGAIAVPPAEPDAPATETGPEPVGDMIVSTSVEKPDETSGSVADDTSADPESGAQQADEASPEPKKSRTGLVLVLILVVAVGAAAAFWPQWRDHARPYVEDLAPQLIATLYPADSAPAPAPMPADESDMAEAPADGVMTPAPAGDPEPDPQATAPASDPEPAPAPDPEPAGASTPAISPDDLAGIDDRLAALEDRVGNLPETSAAEPVNLDPLIARLESLETAVAAPVSADPALLERLAALEERVAAISGTDSDAVTAIGENLAALAARVESLAAENTQLRQQLADLQAARQAQAAKGSSLALAVNQLAQAVSRTGGYDAALRTVTALAGDDPATATALADLAAFAETGAPDLAALRADFPAMARNVMKAISLSEGDDWLTSMAARVKSLVSIRRVGETVSGDEPDALLARAEVALADGRLSDAVQHLSALPEPGLEAASGWLDRARGRLAVTNAIDALQSAAIGALSK
jgi:hypothetical protein